TADDVDDHDQQTGHSIASHKLAGTVHRAVELGLLAHFQTATSRFFFANQTSIQIGVDRHLLARHGVQRESGADFRNTPRTLGDHNEVDDDEDDEHDDTDCETAAHEEVPEGLDDLTRRIGTFMA